MIERKYIKVALRCLLRIAMETPKATDQHITHIHTPAHPTTA